MSSRLQMLAAACLLVTACGSTPSPAATRADVPGEVPITTDCGPVADIALCHAAIQMAIAARQNPPPIAWVRIRRPDPGDACTTDLHPCRSGDIVVDIQSGDVMESIALLRNGPGWIPLSQIR